MFVKCAECGYLTPDNASLCKQCGAVVGAAAEPLVASAAPSAPVDQEAEPAAPLSSEAEAWLAATTTMPPPDPSTAAPPAPVSPARETTTASKSAAPSMFPTPAARPPRRSLPTWTVASGTVLVVAALIVGLMIANSGRNDTAQKRAEQAQAALAAQRSQIDALEASLLTRSDLGSRWTMTDQSGLRPDELAFMDTCSTAPGLQSTATVGRGIDFAEYLDASGTQGAAVSNGVRSYRTAADAEAQYQARLDPSFAPCVAQYNVEFTECTCQTAATNLEVQAVAPPSDVRAAVYRGTVAFDHGGPHKYYLLRAYLAKGRDFALLVVGSRDVPPDAAEFENLLRTVSQRLEVHAQG